MEEYWSGLTILLTRYVDMQLQATQELEFDRVHFGQFSTCLCTLMQTGTRRPLVVKSTEKFTVGVENMRTE